MADRCSGQQDLASCLWISSKHEMPPAVHVGCLQAGMSRQPMIETARGVLLGECQIKPNTTGIAVMHMDQDMSLDGWCMGLHSTCNTIPAEKQACGSCVAGRYWE
jgi:hypothetical protein